MHFLVHIIFWRSRENSTFFSVVFLASTGKKLGEKITEKISGPGNLTLNIPGWLTPSKVLPLFDITEHKAAVRLVLPN